MRRVHWSTLKELAKSPAHYQFALERPWEETPSQRLGTAGHCRALESDDVFHARFVLFDGDRRTKEWKAFQADNVGRTILSREEWDAAHAMADAVRAHPLAAALLSDGEAEQSLQWTHRTHLGSESYEVECGGRMDFVGSMGLVELKTSRAASPYEFPREVAKFDYHGQVAFYADGLLSLGKPVSAVWFVAVENDAPHGVAVYRVPDAVLDAGRERYFLLLDRLHLCERTNHWPAWPEENVLTLPGWKSNLDAEGVAL